MTTIRADRWLVGVRDPRNGRKTHHFDLIIRTMEQESSAALTTETHAQDGQETRIAGRKRESTPYRLVGLRCRHQSFTVRGAGIFCFKKLGQFRTSDWLFSYVVLKSDISWKERSGSGRSLRSWCSSDSCLSGRHIGFWRGEPWERAKKRRRGGERGEILTLRRPPSTQAIPD